MEEKNIKVKKTSRGSANIIKESAPSDFVGSETANKFVDSSIQDEPQEESCVDSDKPKSFSKRFIFSILLVVILIVGVSYFFGDKIPKIGDGSKANSAKIDSQILAKLKTIILLPDDVTPTMAVVTDAAVLKKQQPAFFADCKNGDRLIIYPNLAIVYDYTANKIIKVGPVQNVSVSTSTKK